MGQQSEAQKSSAVEAQMDFSDEGSFLSPEETDEILSTLEEIDRKVLNMPQPSISDDEGVFLSPEDLEGPGLGDRDEVPTSDAPSPAKPAGATGIQRGGESPQSDLLSRIAGELRSIKSEIGTLKNTYDDMISRATSITANEESRREEIEAREAGAEAVAMASGRAVPEETMADLKRLLGYLDRLLESLPEDKIDEFARSEYFELYRKIFEFLDMV
ncbi:MAG TPA: hypothetical protein VN445_07115 [Rectinemataceae bacterium]|nr:hypothetical protein [Rectinemataceae bacterium]